MHSLQTMGSARCRHLSVALLLTLTILLLLLYEDASRIKAISIRRTLTTYTQLLVVPTASSSQLLHLPDQTSFHLSKTYAVSDEAAERFGPILRDLEVSNKSRKEILLLCQRAYRTKGGTEAATVQRLYLLARMRRIGKLR